MGIKPGATRYHGVRKKHCGHIYKVTCSETSAIYIGKTLSQYPIARWKQHLADARAGSSTKFHCAIREYGESTFEFTPIACVLKVEDLAELERLLIQQHDSEVSGYNTDGPVRREKQRSDLTAVSSLAFKAANKIGSEKVIEALTMLLAQVELS